MTLYVSLYFVPGDEKFATQSTLIWDLYRMTQHVFLYMEAEFESIVTQKIIVFKLIGNSPQVVPGDKDLTTQMTVLGIFLSINLYAYLYVVPGCEFISTQSTNILIVQILTLHVICIMFQEKKHLPHISHRYEFITE